MRNNPCIPLAVLGFAMAARGQSVADRQAESARKQVAAAQAQRAAAPEGSFFSAGWSGPSMLPAPPAPMPDCPAMKESEYEPLVRASATLHKLNPDLIKAVIRQESAFRPCSVSQKGAMGLMQIMPDTAESLKTADPFDPAQNIEAGASYLKQMLKRFKGELRLALAAYNAGPEKVDGDKPSVPDIPETLAYVEGISKALHGEPAETNDR